jgi:hypothetical protein
MPEYAWGQSLTESFAAPLKCAPAKLNSAKQAFAAEGLPAWQYELRRPGRTAGTS